VPYTFRDRPWHVLYEKKGIAPAEEMHVRLQIYTCDRKAVAGFSRDLLQGFA